MKRMGCILAVLMLLLGALPVSAGAVELEVGGKSALLMDVATGTVLYEKNAHEKLSPASVTKVMTLLLIMEAIDSGKIGWDDTVTASETAAAKGGSQIYLKVGENMSVSDMVKSIAVSSANDCACAMAEHIAGSEAAFVDMMNGRAQQLGMNDTNFVNCTGLDDGADAGEHLTTSHDIALMSRELLNHEEIRNYSTVWMDSVRGGSFGLSNTNKLIRFYPGATGLKTGFTSAAGYCLSASAERDGIQFIAVVMNCETSDQRFSSAKSLLDYGFANYSLVSPTLPEPLAPIPVTLGSTGSVQPVLFSSNPILTEKEKAANVQYDISLPEAVEAPISAGQQLGTLTLSADGQTLAQLPILAGEAVDRLTWWQAALRIFKKACFG